MSRYLDFLAVEQEFKAITDADKPLDKGAVLTLFSKIEPATDYLNAVSEEHGVKNVVAPCSIADIEGSENVPLIIAYMTIKIEAMKAAFHELAWAIDDLNLPQALEELNTVVESFTEA